MSANRILLPMILDTCGFENRAHVRRVLKKYLGEQPEEYTEEQLRRWRQETEDGDGEAVAA